MRRIVSILCCATFVFAAHSTISTTRAESGAAQAALERLKPLAGKWQGIWASDPSSTMQVEYKVTAGGSAVVETAFAAMPLETVSVFHLEGEDRVMTHYCATGNQPRLRLDPKRSTEGELLFDFAGGSNMDPAKDVHLRFGWNGPDAIDSEWVAYKDGRPDHTPKFSLKRLSK